MKRLTVVLAILPFLASVAVMAAADEGIDTGKNSRPGINWTWGYGKNSTLPAKSGIKAPKGGNIKKAMKSCTKKPCDYIK